MEEINESANKMEEKEEYMRQKRFYPVHVNVGCIKGPECCANPHCRAFCSLCYGKFFPKKDEDSLHKIYSYSYLLYFNLCASILTCFL